MCGHPVLLPHSRSLKILAPRTSTSEGYLQVIVRTDMYKLFDKSGYIDIWEPLNISYS